MKKILRWMSGYIRHTDIFLLFLCIGISALSVVSLVAMAHTGHIDTEGMPMKTAIVQAGATAIGLFFAILISQIDYHTLVKLWKLFIPICVVLVLLTFIIGEGVGDADDVAWLALPGGMSFQPTEVLKIAFIYSFSWHLFHVHKKINELRHVLLLCIHAGSVILLVHFQGDDGTALIFAFIFLSMMCTAGWSLWYFLTGIVAVGIMAPIAWVYVMNDDQRGRILALYHLSEDSGDVLFQQNRALIAIGSGQTVGTGLFSGEHSYVPAIRNDFIFSFISNALGFIGSFIVLLLLLLICLRILWVGHTALDDMGRFICVGVFAMIASQSIINLGMNLSLLPVVGVTLPFLSAGGNFGSGDLSGNWIGTQCIYAF